MNWKNCIRTKPVIKIDVERTLVPGKSGQILVSPCVRCKLVAVGQNFLHSRNIISAIDAAIFEGFCQYYQLESRVMTAYNYCRLVAYQSTVG